MIKREELSNPNSCMVRAHEEEMTFVLLARDIAAPYTIRAWVEERIRLGKNLYSDPQIIEALQCAETMSEQRKAGDANWYAHTAEGTTAPLGAQIANPQCSNSAPVSQAKPDAGAGHRTVALRAWVDVDEGIAPLVAWLQTVEGVRTFSSCQGTVGQSDCDPYSAYVGASWTPEAVKVLEKAGCTVHPQGELWGYIRPGSWSNAATPLQDTGAIDIEKLKALEKAATPGEWESYSGGNFVHLVLSGYHNQAHFGLPLGIAAMFTEFADSGPMEQQRADAEFIAALRNVAPQLLKELEELRAQRDAAHNRAQSLQESLLKEMEARGKVERGKQHMKAQYENVIDQLEATVKAESEGYKSAQAELEELRREKLSLASTLGMIRCVVGKEGTEDSVLDAVRELRKELEELRAMRDEALSEVLGCPSPNENKTQAVRVRMQILRGERNELRKGRERLEKALDRLRYVVFAHHQINFDEESWRIACFGPDAAMNTEEGHGSGPLPGRDVTVVQEEGKTKFVEGVEEDRA